MKALLYSLFRYLVISNDSSKRSPLKGVVVRGVNLFVVCGENAAAADNVGCKCENEQEKAGKLEKVGQDWKPT